MARKKTQDVTVQEPFVAQPEKPPAPLHNVRLPPFSGSRHGCVKCGYSEAATVWMAAGQACSHQYLEGFRSLWGTERLHRTCSRCRFAWDEACVLPARENKETLVMPVVPKRGYR
jgi:hypothetical protein